MKHTTYILNHAMETCKQNIMERWTYLVSVKPISLACRCMPVLSQRNSCKYLFHRRRQTQTDYYTYIRSRQEKTFLKKSELLLILESIQFTVLLNFIQTGYYGILIYWHHILTCPFLQIKLQLNIFKLYSVHNKVIRTLCILNNGQFKMLVVFLDYIKHFSEISCTLSVLFITCILNPLCSHKFK